MAHSTASRTAATGHTLSPRDAEPTRKVRVVDLPVSDERAELDTR